LEKTFLRYFREKRIDKIMGSFSEGPPQRQFFGSHLGYFRKEALKKIEERRKY